MSNRKQILSDLADQYASDVVMDLSAIKFGSWLVSVKGWYFVADNEIKYGELMDALADRPSVEQCFISRQKLVIDS